jgi:hypothetical protein
MAKQISTVEKSASSVIRPNQGDRILVLTNRLFEQTHFLVCDAHLVVRFVIAIVNDVDLVDPKFVTNLCDIERLGSIGLVRDRRV